jgi:hypothetical protein
VTFNHFSLDSQQDGTLSRDSYHLLMNQKPMEVCLDSKVSGNLGTHFSVGELREGKIVFRYYVNQSPSNLVTVLKLLSLTD